MKGKYTGLYVGGKSAKAKKIKQYDLNGNFVKEYASSTEASKAVGVDYSCIIRSCRGQNAFSAKSLWCYSGEENTIPNKVLNAKRKKTLSENQKTKISNGLKGKLLNNASTSKPIVGTNIKTGEVIHFQSTKEAERHGFDASNIAKCASDKYPMYKTSKGYSWKFAEN